MIPIVLTLALVVFGVTVVARRRPARRGRLPAPGEQWLASSFTNEAGSRDYKLYLPRAYRGQPLPLVVMLHGCLQDADDFAAGTGMNQLAESGPFLVVYPEQPRRANSRRCWNWFRAANQEGDRGEPALIAGLTRRVMADYAVDAARVYVAGMSAGGAMAVILAATHPALYAAVGVHSGVAYKAGHGILSAWLALHAGGPDPRRSAAQAFARAGADARAVPLIVFHGGRDRVARVTNAHQIAAQWAHLAALAAGVEDALLPGPTVERQAADGRAFAHAAFRDRDGVTRIETFVVHGLGHAWSGGDAAGSFTDGGGPSASREMVRFFGEHPMPRVVSARPAKRA